MTRILGLVLAGCATAQAAASPQRPPVLPAPPGLAPVERLIGANAADLIALFGAPVADVREGDARKLQFSNAACVLDAYLYPRGNGGPVVTYINTRQSDGTPIDRARCIGALQAGRRR